MWKISQQLVMAVSDVCVNTAPSDSYRRKGMVFSSTLGRGSTAKFIMAKVFKSGGMRNDASLDVDMW